jgi:ubiquinone/menaquinone biosynthesis C-methylase UbiE
MTKSLSQHWNSIFQKTEDSNMGWYEKSATQTFELLLQIPNWETSTIFLTGAGTSVLIKELAEKGARLVLNDISSEALQRARDKMGDKAEQSIWLCQDIAQPVLSLKTEIDIWIDRAVLHFLTEESDIEGYFKNLNSLLKPGGYAVFAEFSEKGADKCAGLKLHRYSLQELTARLGEAFTLISSFDYIYTMPNGNPRPYVYALFKKKT